MRVSYADVRVRAPSGSAKAYSVALLTVLNIACYADRTMISVLVQPIKADLHLSDTQVGLLGGFAFAAVYAAVGLPLARLSDKIGRRVVLAVSVACWSVMTALCGLTHSFGQLALARLGVGFGEASCTPSSHAVIANLYAQGRRTLPLAVFMMGAAIGITVGLALAGKIASLYGWRRAFLLVGLPGVALSLLVLTTLRDSRTPAVEGAVDRTSLWATIVVLLGIPTYRFTVYSQIFFVFSTMATLTWLPVFYIRSHGLSVSQVGLFFGIAYGLGAAFGGGIGAFVLQRLSKEEGGLRWATALVVTASPFFAFALVVSSTVLSLLAIMLFGTLIGAAAAPILAAQQGVVDARCRATASALGVLVSNYLGAGLGSLLLGIASDALAPRWGQTSLRVALLTASAGPLILGIFTLSASRSFQKDSRH